jgi:hypothetical protein
MTSFEIGSQTAASIQNIGGDLAIGHLRVEAAWSTIALQEELVRVRQALDGVPLTYPTRVAAESALAAAQAEATSTAQNPSRIAELLQRATQVLSSAGSLTSGIAESLRQAAVVLGPAGKALLALLPLV